MAGGPVEPKLKGVTVWFYRAERAIASGRWPAGADPESHIRGKLEKVLADPYIDLSDGRYIVESFDLDPPEVDKDGKPKKRTLYLAISAVRRDNLPLRDRKGVTSPLTLPTDENLAEQAHLVFFPRSVVGFVRTQYAPRHIKCASVLSKRCEIDVALAPIVRADLETVLNGSISLSELTFRFAGTSFDAAAADAGDPVETTHRLTSQIAGAGVAEMRFMAQDPPDRQRLRSFAIHNVQKFIDRGAKKLQAKIIDEDSKIRTIDLIEEQISITATVQRRNESRSLEPASTLQAIRDVYNMQLVAITRALEMLADD